MQPRRGYVDGPFGQVHFRQIGTGPAIVLLHQAPMSSAQFDNVYAVLAAHGLQAIGIDMPGFGQSDPAPGVPTIGDYAQVVVPVLDALNLQTVAVLGHHTGALVATELALQAPDRVSALVLNGPLPLTEDERQAFMVGGHQWELAYTAMPGAAHMKQLFDIRHQFAGDSVPLARISDYVVQALGGKGVFWHGHHAAFQYHHDLAMALVTQRTMILTNTGDEIYALALKAHAMRPDFAFLALEGGGIDVVDQMPQAWADAVAGFVLQ